LTITSCVSPAENVVADEKVFGGQSTVERVRGSTPIAVTRNGVSDEGHWDSLHPPCQHHRVLRPQCGSPHAQMCRCGSVRDQQAPGSGYRPIPVFRVTLTFASDQRCLRNCARLGSGHPVAGHNRDACLLRAGLSTHSPKVSFAGTRVLLMTLVIGSGSTYADSVATPDSSGGALPAPGRMWVCLGDPGFSITQGCPRRSRAAHPDRTPMRCRRRPDRGQLDPSIHGVGRDFREGMR